MEKAARAKKLSHCGYEAGSTNPNGLALMYGHEAYIKGIGINDHLFNRSIGRAYSPSDVSALKSKFSGSRATHHSFTITQHDLSISADIY